MRICRRKENDFEVCLCENSFTYIQKMFELSKCNIILTYMHQASSTTLHIHGETERRYTNDMMNTDESLGQCMP